MARMVQIQPSTRAIAEAISGYGKTHGVSQRGVAAALGMTRSTLRRRLADPNGFTIAELRAVAALVDVPAETFVKHPGQES